MKILVHSKEDRCMITPLFKFWKFINYLVLKRFLTVLQNWHDMLRIVRYVKLIFCVNFKSDFKIEMIFLLQVETQLQ